MSFVHNIEVGMEQHALVNSARAVQYIKMTLIFS